MNMIKRLGHPRYKFVFEEREIKKMNNDFVMKILDFVEENEEFEGMICKVADNSYDKKIQVELSLNDIKTCIEITRITDEEIFDTLISEANGMKSRNSKKKRG